MGVTNEKKSSGWGKWNPFFWLMFFISGAIMLFFWLCLSARMGSFRRADLVMQEFMGR